MLKLRLDQVAPLQAAAACAATEACFAGLVLPGSIRNGERDYVVADLRPVANDAYAVRTATAVTLRPEFCTDLANQAKQNGAGVLLAHTHIGNEPLDGFSLVDDGGEAQLAPYFKRRLAGASNFAAIISAAGVHAREMGPGARQRVALVGSELVMPGKPRSRADGKFDRQVRAFGEDGQRALGMLTVAITGLGGTGSVVVQQLAHLGVANFVLIDPDTVETTNLNRLVGATASDIGRPKVDVAADHITRINAMARCHVLKGDVTHPDVAATLAASDFIFCCTDSMASRAVINQLAYQYFIPCIDMGVAIGTESGAVAYIGGRVQMLSPGLACLVCTDKLDSEQVRREMMSPEERSNDRYIVGAPVPQPAVISLNSQVSSAAVTMFLSAVTGMPAKARLLTFDAMRGIVRPVSAEPRPQCIVCSHGGALGQGARWSLPTRGSAR
jgi:molybdopterin/thiamine biosynthesis adenylyltransferase